jgi:hypothetical protein
MLQSCRAAEQNCREAMDHVLHLICLSLCNCYAGTANPIVGGGGAGGAGYYGGGGGQKKRALSLVYQKLHSVPVMFMSNYSALVHLCRSCYLLRIQYYTHLRRS